MATTGFLKSYLWLLIAVVISGCSSLATTNKPVSQYAPTVKKAQFKIDQDRGKTNQKSLVILSLSGGGSRAAYLSASVMLRLENVFDDINLLHEVDVISSVSGGSLPAAYYAISQDRGAGQTWFQTKRYWDQKTVMKLMKKNYIGRWIGNWFWPDNIGKYWFTAYDRSDIMAQTFADNLYDNKITGIDLKFGDINPERPYLIINSTNGTDGAEFGNVFTFTDNDFRDKLGSDIYRYEISRAVMASASFPAVFNYMTLYDYRDPQNRQYMHIFDGGNTDNLGLESAAKVISMNSEYKRVIIILVDAYTGIQGVSSDLADARKGLDYAVDLNLVDSSSIALKQKRSELIELLEGQLNKMDKDKVLFFHLDFDEIQAETLRKRVKSIKTDFKIKDSDTNNIDHALDILIVKNNSCLQDIRKILVEGATRQRNRSYCRWPE